MHKKWRKWQIGAAAVLGLGVMFHEVKTSSAFEQAQADALDSSNKTSVTNDSQVAMGGTDKGSQSGVGSYGPGSGSSSSGTDTGPGSSIGRHGGRRGMADSGSIGGGTGGSTGSTGSTGGGSTYSPPTSSQGSTQQAPRTQTRTARS